MRRVKTLEIVGRVIGPTGPAANAMVNLQPVDGDGADFNRQDTTDEKGSFRLRSVPEGSYYVLVYQREEGTRIYETRARQKVEVADDNIDSLTISLRVGATIQGRLKVDGAHSVDFDRIGLSLMPVGDDGQPGRHADVNKDGSFEIRSVDDGSYSFSVWGLDRGAYVRSVRRGPDDLLEKGLQVEGGSSGKLELIIGSDGAQVDGSVADDDGAVIGARVRLIPDPLTAFNHIRSRTTTTDQLGHFSVSDVPPGK